MPKEKDEKHCAIYRSKTALILTVFNRTKDGLLVFNGVSKRLSLPLVKGELAAALEQSTASVLTSVDQPDFKKVESNLKQALWVKSMPEVSQKYDLISVTIRGTAVEFIPSRKFLIGSFSPLSEKRMEVDIHSSSLEDVVEAAFAECKE